MKPPRRSRILSGEEARLWGEIAKLITPLRGKAGAMPSTVASGARTGPRGAAEPFPDPLPPATAPIRARKRGLAAQEPVQEQKQEAPRAPNAALAPRPTRTVKLADLVPGAQGPGANGSAAREPGAVVLRAAGPLAPGLERKERRALERGSLPIEARIDLHGLYQAEAHAALVGFIGRARALGHARVLVVTGKGGAEGRTGGDPAAERGVLRRSVPHWLRGPDLRGIVIGFEEAGRRHGGAGALYVRLRRR